MKKGIRYYYDHFEEILLISCISVTVIVIFIQVVLRYIFNSSLVWSEELARYLFVWETWVGVSIAAKHGKHICVEMLVTKMKGKLQQAIKIFSELIVIAICSVMTYQGLALIMKISAMHSLSPSMHIPMSYCYAAVPVGCALMIFRCIESIVGIIKGNPAAKEAV